MTKIKMCVPCLFGLEKTVSFEIKKAGGEDIRATDGRVTFYGDFSTLAKANLWVATGERILIEVGSFPARTFDELFENVKALPWEEFIGADDAFPVKGYSINSNLHSVPDCQKIVKKAVVKKLERKYHISYFEETGAKHQIQFAIQKNNCAVYLDTSGEGLHKRGYRRNSNAAPIKETLAAGIVDLARVRGNSIICDPMCGSGTFLIESALKALNIAPGIRRSFAAQKWKQIPEEVWQNARQEALELINRDCGFRAYGSDIDDLAVELSRDNSKKAQVDDRISVKQQDISKFAPKENSITFCNPPYGERMLEIRQAEELYKKLGQRLHPSKENPCYIISPHEEFEKFFGKKADKKRKLYNGMIKCDLYMYFK